MNSFISHHLSHNDDIHLRYIEPSPLHIKTQSEWIDSNSTLTSARFQHVLMASTCPTTKHGDESLTCLNQGQSYELKLRRLHDNGVVSSEQIFKSIVRVIFHDRRLQYDETEQLRIWQQTRPRDRFFDVDIPLSFGLQDVQHDSPNSAVITWNANQDVSVYLRINCISTEFTIRKRGGEKGIPFRIQIETYSASFCGGDLDKIEQPLHCASCKIKVFKPKGAERKNKTDLEKFCKYSEAEKTLFRPLAEVTLFAEMSLTQTINYLEQRRKHRTELETHYKPTVTVSLADTIGASLTPVSCGFSSSDDSAEGYTCGVDQPSRSAHDYTKSRPAFHTDFKRSLSSLSVNDLQKRASPAMSQLEHTLPLTPCSGYQGQCETTSFQMLPGFTPDQVMHWLQVHRFQSVSHSFCNYSGSDMLKLSRDEYILVCGPADGIRLNNAIQSRCMRPRRTIYVCFDLCERPSGTRMNDNWLDDVNDRSKSSSESSLGMTSGNSMTSSMTCSPISSCTHSVVANSDVTFSNLINQWPCSSLPDCFDDNYSYLALPMTTARCSVDTVSTQSHNAALKRKRFVDVDSYSASKKLCSSIDDDKQNQLIYQALYLDLLTYYHLIDKLAFICGIQRQMVSNVRLFTDSGVCISVSDSVVQNMADHSQFIVDLLEDSNSLERSFTVVLKSVGA